MIINTNSFFIILLPISFIVLFSCTTAPPTVYADPPFHAPYFDDVHESQVSVMAVEYKGTAGTLCYRFSHMFRNCMILGVQAYRAERPVVYEGDQIISDTDSVGNKISYYEFSGGPNYILNRYTNMSFLTGLGYGHLSATYAGKMNFVNGIQQPKFRH